MPDQTDPTQADPPQADPPKFSFSAVSKAFDGHVALDGVDLALDAGRTTAVIGQSGSGKSTVLKLLAGLIRPDSGTITVDGADMTGLDLMGYRHRLGYVIQEGGLFPHLTARANVGLVARHLGWPAERAAERVAALRDLVQLPADRLDRYPGELSGGQRQRVSLMRALMLDPDVLLLDEPLGALDPMIRYDLQRELKDIFARLGKTVVLVTHDLAEARYLAAHIVLMHEGAVAQAGGYQELATDPTSPFVRDFLRAQQGPDGGREAAP